MSQIRGDKRIDLGKFVIASIKIKGQKFEILVDPALAWELKKKIRIFQKEKEKEKNTTFKLTVDDVLSISPTTMEDVIEGFMVFHDLKRGDHVSQEELETYFGTTDIKRITAEILLNGELQLTKAQREKFIEEKKKKLINLIARNCINPQTKKPHPPARIERALGEAKVYIDPFNPIEDQVSDIIKKLKPIIPIKMEKIIVSIRLPAQFSGKGYNLIKMFANISKEEWKNDGSFECVAEMPSGIQTEFFEKINKLTRGRAVAQIIETISA
ncbi:MAG: ribosome assembly factor SBDS [Promethearchaeota archaeon]